MFYELHAQAYALSMCPESFVIGDGFDRARIVLERCGRILDHARFLHEFVDRKRGSVACGAARWQRGVRAGNVIAYCFWGPFAHEDRACVANLTEQFHGARNMQLKVLRCDHVDRLERLDERITDDDESLVGKG